MQLLRGKADRYATFTGDPANRTYGVIAYVPNIANTGRVLRVKGVNIAGTQAADKFLVRRDNMESTLDQAREARGKLQTFEVLFGTRSTGSGASTSTPLSERIHQSGRIVLRDPEL